jgi:hypothetical protein
MGNARRRRLLTFGAVLLVFGASLRAVSIAFFGGYIPGFEYGGIHTHSPMGTYQGYFSVNCVGIYYWVQGVPVCA